MTKRPTAFFVAASLALGSAGCTDPQGNVEPGKTALAVITSPIWIPLLVNCSASAGCDQHFRSLSNATAARISGEPNISIATLRTKAEGGDAQAQLALANVHFHGFGSVKQDDVEAAKWYRRSAEGGNTAAQYALATMYEWGRGVAPDDVEADTWYSIAIAMTPDHDAAGDTSRNRELLEARMTPEQIAEARKRAGEWKPS